MIPRFLVVLDTMWGAPGRAPRWFCISPQNHSGRRLYALTGARVGQIWVTNACPQQTGHAAQHGTPSPTWLADSLSGLPRTYRRLPLLVCGAVALGAYRSIQAQGYRHRGPVLYLLHPAARTWTKARLRAVARRIATLP